MIYLPTVKQILDAGIQIFDFEYPIESTIWKAELERDILDYYMYRPIGQETVAMFKHELALRMRLIMPYYNKIYMTDNLEQRILDNYDVLETIKREVSGTNETTGKGTSTDSRKNKFSDTPMGNFSITDELITNITEDNGNNNFDSTTKGTSKNTETYTRQMQGNIGVATDADAILSYRKSLIKLNEMIIDELGDLFYLIYE